MLSYEQELRWKFGEIAKACLHLAPAGAERSIETAKALLALSTGENSSCWMPRVRENNLYVGRTRLFTLVYHVLGTARAYGRGVVGEAFRKVEGGALERAFEALRVAVHGDLMRIHVQLGDRLTANLGLPTPTRAVEERARELIVQGDNAETFTRRVMTTPRKRKAYARETDEDDLDEAAVGDYAGLSSPEVKRRARASGVALRDGGRWLDAEELVPGIILAERGTGKKSH